MDRCANCGIAISRCNALGRRVLDDEAILSVIRQWRAPHPVFNTDEICQACWDLAQRQPEKVVTRQQVGHRNVCLRCGRSLASRVSHLLHNNSIRETRIYNVIKEWITPQPVEETSHICHACWVAADRAATGPSTSPEADPLEQIQAQVQDLVRQHQTEPTIFLPEYMRAKETESRCFIEGCQRKERYRVTLSMRKTLLSIYKYYVPVNNRLCDQHLDIKAWDLLADLRNSYVQTFTARHIQDMLSLKGVVET